MKVWITYISNMDYVYIKILYIFDGFRVWELMFQIYRSADLKFVGTVGTGGPVKFFLAV